VISIRRRPATRAERQLAALWSAAAVSAIILRPLLISIAPMLRPCTFRSLTGVPCPTCGTTRTALALLNLDLSTAFHTNPLAAAVGVAFFAGGVTALFWLLFRGPMISLGLRWTRWWTLAVVIVVIVNWTFLIATH
jgi:hypothetical protein